MKQFDDQLLKEIEQRKRTARQLLEELLPIVHSFYNVENWLNADTYPPPHQFIRPYNGGELFFTTNNTKYTIHLYESEDKIKDFRVVPSLPGIYGGTPVFEVVNGEIKAFIDGEWRKHLAIVGAEMSVYRDATRPKVAETERRKKLNEDARHFGLPLPYPPPPPTPPQKQTQPSSTGFYERIRWHIPKLIIIAVILVLLFIAYMNTPR
jgi:hypothetical protein